MFSMKCLQDTGIQKLQTLLLLQRRGELGRQLLAGVGMSPKEEMEVKTTSLWPPSLVPRPSLSRFREVAIKPPLSPIHPSSVEMVVASYRPLKLRRPHPGTLTATLRWVQLQML